MTPEQKNGPKQALSPKQKIGIGCASLALLALAIGGFVFWKFGADAKSDLEKEIARTKAEGFWNSSFAELVPSSDFKGNASTILHKAFGICDVVKMPLVRDLDDPEDKALAVDYLNKVGPALKLAAEGAAMPDCVFAHDYSMNFAAIPFPELTSMRMLVKALCLRSDLEEREGKKDQAFKDLVVAARLAQFSGKEPTMISVLVEIANDSTVLAQLERSLTRFPKGAQRDKEILSALGPVPPIMTALKAEALVTRQMFNNPFEEGFVSQGDTVHGRLTSWLSRFPAVRMRWEYGAVRFERQLFELLSKDNRTSNLIYSLETMSDRLDKSRRFEDLGLQEFGAVFAESAGAYEHDLALRRMAAQALQIVAAGKTPDALPLKGEASEDPRTNLPLHYSRKSGGFRIYAIGYGGIDHGGKRSGGQVSAQDADYVFEYPYHPPKLPKKPKGVTIIMGHRPPPRFGGPSAGQPGVPQSTSPVAVPIPDGPAIAR